MSKIFANADRVLIWLGLNDPHQLGVERNGQDAALLCSRTSIPWPILSELLENEYFNRLWVAQQIVLARKVSVLLGKTWLSWSAMRASVPKTQRFTQDTIETPPNCTDSGRVYRKVRYNGL